MHQTMKKSLPAFGIIIVWLSISFLYSRDLIFISPGDGQRDAAIITNILSGNILGDPAYAGEHAWYPFLMHIYFAVIYLFTHIPVQQLLSTYIWLAPTPSILAIALFLYTKSRSWLYVSIGLLTFLLFVPWTQELFLLNHHPFVFSLGVVCLALFTFSKALSTGRTKHFLAASIAIALLVYSHTIAALSVCAGFVLYMIISRKYFGKFILMALGSFLLTLPYLWPLLSIYKLTPVNSSVYSFTGIYNVHTTAEILNAYFYGFGALRWFNSFLILIGIITTIMSKIVLNRLILAVYFVSLLMTLPSLTYYFKIPFPFIPSFAPHDFQIFNHFVAGLLLTQGAWVGIKKIHKPIALPVFIIMLSINLILIKPVYQEKLYNRHQQLLNGNVKEADWVAASTWINDNAKITDVIATTPDRSYFFVSGFTGRKVVATHNNFANAFVDQNKRLKDLYVLYSASDQEKVLQIVRQYNVLYIIASPYESAYVGVSDLKKFDTYPFLTKVFTFGTVTIYKVST